MLGFVYRDQKGNIAYNESNDHEDTKKYWCEFQTKRYILFDYLFIFKT